MCVFIGSVVHSLHPSFGAGNAAARKRTLLHVLRVGTHCIAQDWKVAPHVVRTQLSAVVHGEIWPTACMLLWEQFRVIRATVHHGGDDEAYVKEIYL